MWVVGVGDCSGTGWSHGPTLLAGDPSPALLDWVVDNLTVTPFSIGTAPPLTLADDSIDVLVAYSVLTHLPADEQRSWLADWERVVRPGGLIICSTHGRSRHAELDGRERARFDGGEVVVRHPLASGHNLCAAFLPPAAAASLFAGLAVVDHIEPTADQPWDHDLWVLRKGPRR